MFGFPLSGLDLRRQAHEEVVARPGPAVQPLTTRHPSEPERVELLSLNLAPGALLIRDDAELSELATQGIRTSLAAARGGVRRSRGAGTTSSRCVSRCRTYWRR